MTKNDILTQLKNNRNYIKQHFGVDKIGLFGSYAKDTYNANSDIDIYVEFKNKTFDNIAGLWNYLENLYNKKIDLIHNHRRANKIIMANIQKEVVYG